MAPDPTSNRSFKAPHISESHRAELRRECLERARQRHQVMTSSSDGHNQPVSYPMNHPRLAVPTVPSATLANDVTREELAALPTRTFLASSNDTVNADGAEVNGSACEICLVEFIENDSLKQLPCKHEYHATCIDEWLMQRPNCPKCRTPLRPGLAKLERGPRTRCSAGCSTQRHQNLRPPQISEEQRQAMHETMLQRRSERMEQLREQRSQQNSEHPRPPQMSEEQRQAMHETMLQRRSERMEQLREQRSQQSSEHPRPPQMSEEQRQAMHETMLQRRSERLEQLQEQRSQQNSNEERPRVPLDEETIRRNAAQSAHRRMEALRKARLENAEKKMDDKKDE